MPSLETTGRGRHNSPPPDFFDLLIRTAAIAAGVLLLLGLAFPSFGDRSRKPQVSTAAGDAKKRTTLLIPSAARLDFGTVKPGARSEKAFSVHNPGPTPVTVADIRTSCECFQIRLQQKVVGPGQTVPATAVVDFSKDAQFVGRLRLRADGSVFTESGPKDGFALEADVDVR